MPDQNHRKKSGALERLFHYVFPSAASKNGHANGHDPNVLQDTLRANEEALHDLARSTEKLAKVVTTSCKRALGRTHH